MLSTVLSRLSKFWFILLILVSGAVYTLFVCLTGIHALIADILLFGFGIMLIPFCKNWSFADIGKIERYYPANKLGVSIIVSLLFLTGLVWGQQEQFLRLCPIIVFVAFTICYSNSPPPRMILYLMLISVLLIPTRNSLTSLEILVEPTAKFVAHVISIFGISLKQDYASLSINSPDIFREKNTKNPSIL